MAGKGDESRSTNALLAEILDVLKRMDGQLNGQDERIGALETGAARRRPDGANLSRIETNTLRPMLTDADSPTAGPAIRHIVPRLNAEVKFGLRRSDDLQRRRSSAWTDHQDVLNQLRRESTHGGYGENGAGVMHRSHSLGRGMFKQKMWDTLSLPPLDVEQTHSSGDLAAGHSALYTQCPPPPGWISTKISGRLLEIQYGLPEAEKLWNSYVGDSWTIPPDGRVELSFQRHLLERLEEDQAANLLKLLVDVTNKLEYQNPNDRAKRGSFRVSDFDIDPNYEESGMDYRSEFFTGMYKSRPLSSPRTDRLTPSTTASWKRMIEIRGLSRKVIDNDEIMAIKDQSWSTVLRDPWAEAIPKLNSVFPFFTEREESHVGKMGVSRIIDRALEHHQGCLTYTPSKEDSLCFHIVFYELISLRDDEDLKDEIWKHGKLHSDDVRTRSRRLRESACTIIVIPDPSQPQYWTSLFLCPFNFDLYEKIPRIIATQDAPSVAADMVEFTTRVIINRWLGITEYFAWLIGHRDALADPEIHDSLLFDDASFSRSRRYFWAINYLAELDESIAGNILQLERWIAAWPRHLSVGSREIHAEVRSLPERLNELITLQLRLRALRQEAIALRDGLFSASGVIESRAATRLGENVKLLTFVSIFFLPLSFCMSIFTLSPPLLPLSALALVAVLLPVGTYTIVFNLNNLVRLSSRVYKRYKRVLVAQMKQDSDARWSERGRRFETFRPRAERVEPSNWMLGWWVLWRGVRVVGLGGGSGSGEQRRRQAGRGGRGRADSERKETRGNERGGEEHELDFSILDNGPRGGGSMATVDVGAGTGRNTAGQRRRGREGAPTSPEHNTFLKGFSKLSFKFRRDAIVPGSVASV